MVTIQILLICHRGLADYCLGEAMTFIYSALHLTSVFCHLIRTSEGHLYHAGNYSGCNRIWKFCTRIYQGLGSFLFKNEDKFKPLISKGHS